MKKTEQSEPRKPDPEPCAAEGEWGTPKNCSGRNLIFKNLPSPPSKGREQIRPYAVGTPFTFKQSHFVTCSVQYDYIIVGQGIAGTILAWQLEEAGAQVLVIDEAIHYSASRVSSAMVNPVTGRRFVKSWLIDDLLLSAKQTYEAMGRQIGVDLMESHDVLRVFKSAMEQNDFNGRLGDPDYTAFLSDFEGVIPELKMDWGAGLIQQCFRVKNKALLNGFRKAWLDKGAMIEGKFDYSRVAFNEDGLSYGDVRVKGIIFSEGFRLRQNPFFNFIPLVPNKGEALLIDCPALKSKRIIKKGVTIVPWEGDTYWVGATMHLDDDSPGFGGSGEIELCAALDQVLKVPYTVIDRLVGIRPTNSKHRRPYIGAHPQHPGLFVFNGFGTKGTSLIPYFALALRGHLLNGEELLPEVGIEKYWNKKSN